LFTGGITGGQNIRVEWFVGPYISGRRAGKMGAKMGTKGRKNVKKAKKQEVKAQAPQAPKK
jgi:hypothetical protein